MATAVQTTSRVLNSKLAQKIMSAHEAAALIKSGDQVGMSGFTGSGYPKEVPIALARHIAEEHIHGNKFQVSVFTGASTGPELDGALALAGGINLRLPYQSDPETRKRINAGEMEYMDVHLSHVAQFVEYGFLGKMDVALIEVAAVLEDGRLLPSSSIGNNKTWIDCAERVILEVNAWQPLALEGMHDIYYGLQPPPNRGPIPLVHPGQRIGSPYLEVAPEKVAAIVLTDSPDRNSAFKAPDKASKQIAGHILEFLSWEVKKGRMPANLLPLQSGVGNIANAVLFGLEEGPFEGLTSYTEVIQDGMIRLLQSGKMTSASATAFSLSPDMLTEVNADMASYRDRIVLAAAGDLEPSRNYSAAGCDCYERDDRGRHLRQRELDTRDGIADTEWDWRVGRFRAQWIPVDLHGSVDRAEGIDFDDRSNGVARGPYGARCAGGSDGTRPRGFARVVAAAEGETDHREVRESGLQGRAGGLPEPGGAAVVWQAHAASADGVAGVAQPVSAERKHAAEGRELRAVVSCRLSVVRKKPGVLVPPFPKRVISGWWI